MSLTMNYNAKFETFKVPGVAHILKNARHMQ